MDKEQFKQLLGETLQEMGWTAEGKPTFVTAADFGKTATVIGQIKKSLEGLVPQAKLNELIKELGFEQSEDGKYAFKAGAPATPPPGAPKPDDDVVKQLRAELDKMSKGLAERDRVIADEKAARETAEVHRQIQDAMLKHGAINPSRDYVHLTNLISKTADGKLIGKAKDKYGQEQELDLDPFVEQWLGGQPELKRATAAPGAGTPAGQQPGARTVLDVAKMSPAEYMAKGRQQLIDSTAR